MHIPSNVEVIDCGCDLLSLIPYLNKPQKIIIIDAIRAGGKPGEIYRLDYNELKTRGVEMQSSHQVRATDALGLLKQIYPVLAGCEIIIIGIEPKAMELITCLSEKVRESIADVVRLILEEISCCPSEKPYPDEKLKPRLMNFLMGMVYSLTDLKKKTKMRLKLAHSTALRTGFELGLFFSSLKAVSFS